MIQKLFLSLLYVVMILPGTSFAESKLLVDSETFEKAKVVSIIERGTTTSAQLDTESQTQTIQVQLLSGSKVGKTVQFDNDYTQLSVGEVFFVRHQSNADGGEYWSVADPYRLDILMWLAIAFVVLIFIFGGIQGVRGLASLVGSMVLIFYLLIPGISQGYNAVLISISVASLIIVVGSYVTHGFTRTTTSAVMGMIVTVLITGVAAYLVVHLTKLSGYSSEEAMYLTLNSRGAINIVGLLFAGIMIGLLGVLYDIAIGQAVAIEELFRAGKHMTRTEVYKRGIRIGREHIGALVNTLAIAYVGASLPLLLLMQNSTSGILFILNSEVIATEVVRILIGSIGLVLAVPVTTYIASVMLYGRVQEGGSVHSSHHH